MDGWINESRQGKGNRVLQSGWWRSKWQHGTHTERTWSMSNILGPSLRVPSVKALRMWTDHSLNGDKYQHTFIMLNVNSTCTILGLVSRDDHQTQVERDGYIPIFSVFQLRQLFIQYLFGLKTKPLITKTNFLGHRAGLIYHSGNCVGLCRFLITKPLEISWEPTPAYRIGTCFWCHQDSATTSGWRLFSMSTWLSPRSLFYNIILLNLKLHPPHGSHPHKL